MERMMINTIDLFAGCGGLMDGFEQSGKFRTLACVEWESAPCENLKKRLRDKWGYSNSEEMVLRFDIQRTAELFCGWKDEVYGESAGLNNLVNKGGKVDLIIGGPPCQAYSLLGRHKKDMDNDPRTLLYLQYGKFLKEFSPRGFVFENVPGLLSSKKGEHFKNLQIYFRELGYNVYFKMLNASNYGVIQDRHRLIIVGWKQDEDFGYPDIQTTELTATINDLLYDLPNLKAGEVQQISCYSHSTNQYLLESGIRLSDDTFVTQNIARSLNSNDANIYAYAIKLWNENGVRVKYTDLPAEYKTQKNEKSFLDRFKVVDGNGKSHTIVAHLSKDGHYYIHPSLDYCRSISVREAARIQSFPDNFYFEGSRSAMYKQIGNAVPPLMAKAIAESIKQIMQNKKTIIK